MAYNTSSGINIKVPTQAFKAFEPVYASAGYASKESGQVSILTADADLFSKQTPQFMHAYVNKMFGAIPHLFLVAPMPSRNRYSQLCMTYMVAFELGMLARYFPTLVFERRGRLADVRVARLVNGPASETLHIAHKQP